MQILSLLLFNLNLSSPLGCDEEVVLMRGANSSVFVIEVVAVATFETQLDIVVLQSAEIKVVHRKLILFLRLVLCHNPYIFLL